MSLDLLLRGATTVDGTGAEPRRLDVGVRAGRIRYLGVDARPDATRTLDLTGLVLAPGFVDIHTHSDVSLLHDPAGESKVLQGVTTEVVGNCGFSAFPVHGDRRAMLSDHLARLGDPPTTPDWADFPGYAGALDAARPAVNVAALVGHSALRIAAMADPYGPAGPRDLDRMRHLLDAALAAGAYGMSTGLTHTPSALGDTAEVTALVQVCARHGALYATHARAAAGRELAAIDEAIDTTRAAGGRLQFSHLALNDPAYWGRAADALARFDTAAAVGLDVAFDVYPYDASSSALIQYLPPWVQEGGSSGLRANAADPGWRSRAEEAVRGGFFGGIPWHWERVTVTAAGPHRALAGQSVAAIAAARGERPERVVLDLCVDLGDAVQVVLHYRTEADMTAFLAHPLSVVGSDGNALPLAGADLTHPRAFGTFPRVLGRYTKLLGLPTAVRKMTLAPARRLGLTDRGLIAEGAVADLVAFDPGAVLDRATFDQPRRAPAGIAVVMVGGQIVVRDGTVGAARPGKVLRRGR
ncbi:N-acyl-D-amino-acid deacylase family protein [Phytohabitans suffuscus]|uniref:N-acyl-D-amino-acid deacylase n=1 Tax=Phytohabitans suffuscus TaxID=624315 RepID=A0A6F8YCQ4_9ACTN|nr:amidohydrolase family protein [Phytohabitans suffuscus]BCB83914.1 N-acyl-D-amino-acid deacylase [Phytohabitans suffuscus]